ncbi:hypothetical protein, partial [Fibrobacter sp.]|uniref:hypothetical protein n=1 Tax=Fibrobacter sp. TaxID=35828 RepID=UPI00386E1E68
HVYLNRGSAKPALDKHKRPTPITGRERSLPFLKCLKFADFDSESKEQSSRKCQKLSYLISTSKNFQI